MKAAMDYGRLGWSVVPVEPRGKAPLIPWEVYQHRRPETTEIGDWFARWPDANLALVMGVVSDLVVVDLDPRQGGQVSCVRLEEAHGPLPETVEARSGGGGRHVYFRHPSGIIHERIVLAPGIELRGDGGCVVAPPSIHACGEAYHWVRSPEVFSLEPLPAWMVGAVVEQGRSAEALARWKQLSRTGVQEGERQDVIAVLTDHLLEKGVAPTVVRDLILCWNAARCHPPLPRDKVLLTIEEVEQAYRKGQARDP